MVSVQLAFPVGQAVTVTEARPCVGSRNVSAPTGPGSPAGVMVATSVPVTVTSVVDGPTRIAVPGPALVPRAVTPWPKVPPVGTLPRDVKVRPSVVVSRSMVCAAPLASVTGMTARSAAIGTGRPMLGGSSRRWPP